MKGQKSGRVIGGKDTEVNEYPWMALLRRKSWSSRDFFCGGTLVDSRWILTAAHCIKQKQEVVAGRDTEHFHLFYFDIFKDVLFYRILGHLWSNVLVNLVHHFIFYSLDTHTSNI